MARRLHAGKSGDVTSAEKMDEWQRMVSEDSREPQNLPKQ